MKEKGIWILVFIVLIVLGIFFSSKTTLFSSSELTLTPSWHLKYGHSGDNYYGGNYNIGNLDFSSGAPIYLKDLPQCKSSGDISNKIYENGTDEISVGEEWFFYPQPRKECWMGSFSFDGDSFEIKPDEWIKINDYIEVSWKPTGQIYKGDVCHAYWVGDGEDKKKYYECRYLDYQYDWQDPEWTSKYTFRIYDDDFFITSIKDKHLADTIQEEAFITYEIDNDLTKIDGGSIVREKHKLWSPSNSEKTEFFKVYKGTNTYKTSISSETLGDKKVLINPFMIVNNVNFGSKSEVYIYSNSDEKELRILPNIQNIPEQDEDFWNRNPTTLTPTNLTGYEIVQEEPNYLMFFGIFMIVFLIVYFIAKNGKK